MEKYYIFDWDGVLADSFDACNRAKVAMGNNINITLAEKTTLDYAMRKNLHTRKGTRADIEAANTWTENFAQHMIHEDISLFTEFIEEIKKLPIKHIAIVSSSPGIVIHQLLKTVDLDFTHVLAYEDHHSKEEKVEDICRDWHVNIADVHYFTDTQTDVWELSEIMDTSKIIGCAWGYIGYDALREVLPQEQILTEYTDIHQIS